VRVRNADRISSNGGADADIAYQRDLGALLVCFETLGLMDVVFELTVEFGRDRSSFGQSILTYQALRHKIAELRSWLEVSRGLASDAAEVFSARSSESVELLSVAKAQIARFGLELVQDCVQLHGGIGLTWEYDLHVYVRRATVNAFLFGDPTFHLERVADQVERAYTGERTLA
jgi:alkylation response protein AidB-like acyl-CoA dehydrogenase